MGIGSCFRRALAVVTVLPCLAAPAHAGEARGFFAGGGAVVSVPEGEFGDQVDLGGGFNLQGGWRMPGGALALRGDIDFVIYGSETIRVPLSETVRRVELDVTTDNWFGSFRVGPQLMLPHGPVRPYARVQAGFSYFATTSGVSGSDNVGDFAQTTNFDDFTFCYSVGAGLYLPLRQRPRSTLALDLGVTYLHNGRIEYLAEGDIDDSPEGDLVITPRRGQANLFLVQLGVTFMR